MTPSEGIDRFMRRLPNSETLRKELPLLTAFLAGVLIRFYKLPQQILVGDEWHSINKLLTSGYTDILTDFGKNDHSIPLTLLFRFLTENLILTEWLMRTPSFLAGTAFLIAAPLLLRRFFGRSATNLLAWLIALSPLLIYYSRMARPYSITVLLSLVGVVTFYKWWTVSDSHSYLKWVYISCAVPAPWFNLACLPTVLSPLGFAALERTTGRGRSWGQLFGCTAWTGVGMGLLLGPPLMTRFQAISDKLGQSAPTLETVEKFFQFMFGLGSSTLLPVLGILTALGIWVALGRERRLTLLLLLTVLLQAFSVVLLQPRHVDAPIAFTRYCLFACPVLLAFLAIGLVRVDCWFRDLVGGMPSLIPPLSVACLVYFGPLLSIYTQPNNWTNQTPFPDEPKYAPLLRKHRPSNFPQFYYDLSRLPAGSRLLLEAPWYYFWHSFPLYQQIHRQRMLIGFVDTSLIRVPPGEIPFGKSGIRFSNSVHVRDHARLMAKGVDFVVFHKQIREEMGIDPRVGAVDVLRWIEEYRTLYGEPVYEDSFLTVFDVKALQG